MLIKQLLGLLKRVDVNETDLNQLVKYLQAYKYLKSQDFTINDILWAVDKFNKVFGVDGKEITPQTIKATQYARCGCPDMVEDITDNSKWAYNHLKYYIDAFVPGLSKDEQRAITKQCGLDASAVCGLTFEEVFNANQANIVLTTGRQNGLGTVGNVLAYAYLPSGPNHTSQLEAVFDLADTWIKDSTRRGILYRNVANHEVFCGHAVGLTHSTVQTCLMAPFYSPNVATPQLNDDIKRLQARYGKPQAVPTPTPTDPPVSSDNPEEVTLTITGKIRDIQASSGFRIYRT